MHDGNRQLWDRYAVASGDPLGERAKLGCLRVAQRLPEMRCHTSRRIKPMTAMLTASETMRALMPIPDAMPAR